MNEKFTVYARGTGMVLYSGVSHDPAALEDQDVRVKISHELKGGWIDNDVHFNQPPQPSEHHTFDWVTKQWIDPRTLQSKIDGVRAAIKAERDRRKVGGALVDGKWFHSDGESRIQQLALVVMGANVPAVSWKTMDGTFVTMTQAIASAIFQASAVLDITLFANAERHLAAASDSADPEAYDFSTGWPEHFPL